MAAVLDAHVRGDLIALRTSGTTGRARSVVRTTDSWFDSFDHVTGLLDMDAASTMWVPGPLSATMNLFAAVHAADLGARLVPGAAAASHAVLTPAALSRALAQGVDLSGVHVLVAGDRLGPELRDTALAHGASRVSHYYGAAELSFVAWGSHSEDLRPFPGVELECREGVVWVRSPYLCLGYDGTDGHLSRDPEGFATVGDRGELRDSSLRLRGRTDDVVVTAGATVLVADVEAALDRATGHSVAVLGLPHRDLGEVVCGVVTDRAALASLRAAAREVLDPPQRPRRWFEVRTLPLTAAGKLDREALLQQLVSAESTR
ncbi:MAG TPA: o-succinylbenzoate--CoA ligase [Nocardioidaceae bacterium]|nr:o-succinylbenzoate--CoA ligase [Nocardioidaceae bacterium]